MVDFRFRGEKKKFNLTFNFFIGKKLTFLVDVLILTVSLSNPLNIFNSTLD